MSGKAAVILLFTVFGITRGESPECSAFGEVLEVANDKRVLTSPGFLSGSTLDNVQCLWVIQGPEDKYVELTVTDVQLKGDPLCMNEYLGIESDGSWGPYLRYCRPIKPKTVVLAISSNPRVQFVSGIQNGFRKGFRLEYRLLDEPPECGDGQIACQQPFKCIPSGKQCDGRADCPAGEDEEKCGHKPVQPTQCGIAQIPPDLDRIVGGQEAVPGSWPWLASVQGNYLWPSGHGCGATLLNNLYVMTAAHCVVGRLFRVFRVKFGDYNQFEDDEGEFTRDVAMYYLHPDYVRFNASNDLAILKLSAPIEYSNKVAPICLPEPNEELADGTVTYAAGWGTTDKLQHSDVVRQVATPVIDWEKCKDMVIRKLNEKTICTGFQEGGKNPCFGDSGGPLMKQKDGRWALHGVVSWGPNKCGDVGQPSVYTKISEHIAWIKEVISE